MSPEIEAGAGGPGGGGGREANTRRRKAAFATGLAAAALFAAFFINGCRDEGTTPKAALDNFMKAEAAGDTAASYAYLSSADKKQLAGAAWSARAEQLTQGGVGGEFHFVMSDATLSGDRATVDVLMGDVADAGNARDVRFLMVKEKGAWKVSFLKTVAGPVRHVETGGGIDWSNVAFGSGTDSTARTIIHLIMFVAIYAFYGIGLQRIAGVKGLRRPWLAWVPVLNIYTAWKIAGRGTLSTVLSLIPIVNIVMYVLFCFNISRACGKGRLYGFLQLIPLVNLAAFWLLVESAEDGAATPAPAPA